MKWVGFHHPDISLPVVRRRMSHELMEMLELVSVFLTEGAMRFVTRSCCPDDKAYRNAVYRLRKQGLVVGRSVRGETPKILLSEKGRSTLPDYFKPNLFWKKKWNGIWYLFVYDVPEVDRKYRDVLRRFLRQLRMGCLQQSVWVTPFDIRPRFDDLTKAAGIDSFAYLFESKTVLRLPNRRIVDEAWNFRRLYDVQTRFCGMVEANLDLLHSSSCDQQALTSLLRISLNAFHAAFADDPLLPRKLWPNDYKGEEAFELYRKLLLAISNGLDV